ncbi:MAG: alanine racemase [bacterium]
MNKQDEDSLSPPLIQREYEDPWNKLNIDLDAVKFNYHYIKSKLSPGTIFYAVLKSDAYGHDLKEIGRVLSQAGCMHFAVESPQEGIRLRNEGISGEILLMNPIPSWMAELSVRHDLSVSVIYESILQPLEEAAQLMGKICRIHLNVNIGLNRMGIAPSKILKIAKEAASKPHIQLEGLFGQPRDSTSALESFRRLKHIYDKLKSADVAPYYLHFANSTTFLAHPETIADGVRLGILLYGVLPPEQYKAKSKPEQLKPVMSLKSEIVQIRQLPKGSKIGYRSKEKTEQDLIIGTIPIGYNHGLDRKLLNGGYVIVHEQKAPFIGAISMNSSTIDITGIEDAKVGDEVIIFGRQGKVEISINELAEKSNTIAAELMIRFGKSIARRFSIDEQDITSEIVIEQEKTDDIHIRYLQTENELPEWVNLYDIVNFLQTHLIPYDDPRDVICAAVDYALSSHPSGKGFILLATRKRKILGVVVSVQLDKIGIIPENLIVYVCVHQNHRGKGLGTRLIQEAIDCTDGDVKLHVEKTNPAYKLYKKIGFKDDYMEMRFLKG